YSTMPSPTSSTILLFTHSHHPRHPHSFPTRRSSDLDPNLPPDYPLEPGSGTPRIRAIPSAAERIAASEAALGGAKPAASASSGRSEEHTSELQSLAYLVCRLLLEKKKQYQK